MDHLACGDIIQITDENHAWHGCLLVISEVKPWGVQAYIAIPQRNDQHEIALAYNRLAVDTFTVVGKVALDLE
jgi:hypothetical protein